MDERQPLSAFDQLAKGIFFSAKEAVYKCVAPLIGTPLGFHDVEISVAPDEGRFTAWLHKKSGRIQECHGLEGRFFVSSSHVFTSALLFRLPT